MQQAIAYLKLVEKCSLTPYLDSANVSTIGYGQTYYVDGRRVSMNDHKITQEYANQQFNQILIKVFWPIVQRMPRYEIMSDGLRSALLSFCYNTGYAYPTDGFDSLNKVLKNALWRDFPQTLMKYCKADGTPLLGLARRRYGEILLSKGILAQQAYTQAWAMESVSQIMGVL
jgi:lysozyme